MIEDLTTAQASNTPTPLALVVQLGQCLTDAVVSTAAEVVGSNVVEDPTWRIDTFRFDIASGMLESLGLNMYTSIGKSLSEFVANAHDAEATKVGITIPYDQINGERAALREAARRDVADGRREKFTVLSDPLPSSVSIVIEDDGHGMSPQGIQDKFLIINRNRRQASNKSENGLRDVMGRKGLGKLAGFGTAERITIWSKRKGVSFATEFTMDYGSIKIRSTVRESSFTACYEEGLPSEQHGTRVTLTGLRCDSLRASKATIEEVLAQNFAILGTAFQVQVNDELLEEPPSEYEFVYPAADLRNAQGFGTATVEVSDVFTFDIQYVVRFRARETDDTSVPPVDARGRTFRRGSLETSQRGARIYCHGRLSAGPTLLKLHTGMHNFHAQSYMQCIVFADEIDKQTMDYIGTNRGELKGDSDVVEALRDTVTNIMAKALLEHSKFRDLKVEQLVEQDEFTSGLLARIDSMPKGVKNNTKALLKTLASSQGVKSDLYKATAPLVLQSMNAGEVLTNLIRLETDPKSLQIVAHELLELARVENSDVLKLYRGRRAGIEAVRELISRAKANWKRGTRFENDLHRTLKENPWILGPDFNRCLTSDKPLADVARELSEVLKVDEFCESPKRDAQGNIEDEDDRPDLVFITVDAQLPNMVTIVELKTPNYPLRIEHYNQVESYRFRVEQWLNVKYGARNILVRALLIGDLDITSNSVSVLQLNSKMQKQGPESSVTVLPLRLLLERAKQTHLDAIEVAAHNEGFYEAELSTTPTRVSSTPTAKRPSETPAANDSAPATGSPSAG